MYSDNVSISPSPSMSLKINTPDKLGKAINTLPECGANYKEFENNNIPEIERFIKQLYNESELLGQEIYFLIERLQPIIDQRPKPEQNIKDISNPEPPCTKLGQDLYEIRARLVDQRKKIQGTIQGIGL
jgi:hypothetical protein